MRDEFKELNQETRDNAGGSFAQLSNGHTHYELGGNPTGEVTVLVHGFSVPYFIYDPTFKFLSEAGFYVLRYDLFGRGFSDRPSAHYNIDLFVDQLAELLDVLRFTRPVNLIGLSMGGPIASTFTVRYPKRVNRLVLIDPAGAEAITLSPMLRAAKLPFVAEAVFSVVGSESLLKGTARDFFDHSLVEHFISQYRIQMQYEGFRRALLSTVRNGMLDSFIHVYEALATMDIRILLLWGRNDVTIPFEHSQVLLSVLPQAEFHVIENTGHIPHYERPDEVNPILLEFLR